MENTKDIEAQLKSLIGLDLGKAGSLPLAQGNLIINNRADILTINNIIYQRAHHHHKAKLLDHIPGKEEAEAKDEKLRIDEDQAEEGTSIISVEDGEMTPRAVAIVNQDLLLSRREECLTLLSSRFMMRPSWRLPMTSRRELRSSGHHRRLSTSWQSSFCFH